jgi:NAD dependent epimerase/dehydratase family enzyme
VALGRQRADELVLCSQRVVPARLTETGYRYGASTVASALEVVLRR